MYRKILVDKSGIVAIFFRCTNRADILTVVSRWSPERNGDIIRTIINKSVPDVDVVPGHIASSSDSKSEIVVPGIKEGEVIFVFDVDSTKLHELD